jgi:hypothetical protein
LHRQSIDGGKTLNLVALGLLAKNESLRARVMDGFFTPGALGTVASRRQRADAEHAVRHLGRGGAPA